ncbi:hypothetical protein [Microseira wollei]|nr:hypothetical protein [Microseira wollei]
MYEMDISDRNLLLRELKEQFGQERFDELGEFLLDYVAQRLSDDDADTRDLAEAQEWTVLAYTKPDEVARELAQRLRDKIQQEDVGEVLRLTSLVETLAQPLVEAGFEPLLVDVRRIASEVRENFKAPQEENLLESASRILHISEQIEINQFDRFIYDYFADVDPLSWMPVNPTIAKYNMPRLVITPIGTSLLTNQIDISFEYDWLMLLWETTNLKNIELEDRHPDVADIIHTLKERAIQKLNDGNILDVRRASTEIGAIYALYQGNLEQGKQDVHFLIASDTAISTVIANIIQDFLVGRGLNVQIYQPTGFSTASSEAFNHGADDLLLWLDNLAPSYRESGYRISFNLVASSRALQGYMDTIGMLYADEMIYILEGANPTLINIPKIPMKFDISIINPMKFALMEAGYIDLSNARDIPKQFIFVLDNEVILSNLGTIWKSCKNELLSRDLLYFPGLAYEESFRYDYERVKNWRDRVRLQETLAKVSYLLTKADGDPKALKQDGGLAYEKFSNIDLFHFRVSLDLRVSCSFSNGTLRLRRCGYHEYVNRKP